MNKQYQLPLKLRNVGTIKIDKYALNFQEQESITTTSTCNPINQPQSLHYCDDFIKTNCKDNQSNNGPSQDQPVSESPKTLSSFQQFFTTTSLNEQNQRASLYHKMRQKLQSVETERIKNTNNFKDLKQSNISNYSIRISQDQHYKDQSWRYLKSRIKGVKINPRERKTIFNKKIEPRNEHRFNNYNQNPLDNKHVPKLQNYQSHKPLLNNMQTPLVYYDQNQKMYQKITFGETMDKCLFDYSKSAKKQKDFEEKKYTRSEIEELVKQQEVIDHNIEKMRNRLAINRAYPTPSFDDYMSRSRPSSVQMKMTPQNLNFYQRSEKVQRIDIDKKQFSPNCWKKRAQSRG